jgi:3-methyladenine DNA glycosylase Mpg
MSWNTMPAATDSLTPLPRTFYDRDVVTVARELLGKCLVRRSGEAAAAGIIVEAEAYAGANDPAAHSYRGPTRRNATMFGPPGHLYVYSIHARYCLNVVAEPEGVGHAVLIEVRQRQRVDHALDVRHHDVFLPRAGLVSRGRLEPRLFADRPSLQPLFSSGQANHL